MIAALFRFTIENGRESDVRADFVTRAREVERVPGFLGLEVFQNGTTFVLLTRWTDEQTFRTWHDSAQHCESHPLIPPGINLDPAETLMVVGERIDSATSEGDLGAMSLDLFLPLARVIGSGSTLHVVTLDNSGGVSYANEAFRKAAGRDVDGVALRELVSVDSRASLDAHLAGDGVEPLILQLSPRDGELRSLRAVVQRGPRGGFALIAEPPTDDHAALEATLGCLNSELAVLARENARQARALEKANRELREAHWHLEKISEVLPMCMSCRAVKTGENTWEDVATFLTNNSDFLSHGYCGSCAARMLAEDD